MSKITCNAAFIIPVIFWSTSVPNSPTASLIPSSKAKNVSLKEKEQKDVKLPCFMIGGERILWVSTSQFYFHCLMMLGYISCSCFLPSNCLCLLLLAQVLLSFLQPKEHWVSQELFDSQGKGCLTSAGSIKVTLGSNSVA